VVRDEPDRRDDHRVRACGGQGTEFVEDIRRQPRRPRGAAATLVGQPPVGDARRLGDQPARFPQLRDVRAPSPAECCGR
jgi:hypothetical protein